MDKELHYFDRFYAGKCTSADLRRYHDYFPRDGSCKVGEWTPLYMSATWIPQLLAAAAPKARLLVLLRDPVERYVSGMEHNVRIAEECGTRLSQLAPLEAFMRGFYHAQLTQLMRYFDRSQLLVLQYEKCVREPGPELQRTYEFLTIADTQFVPDIDAHPNASRSQKLALDAHVRDDYIRAFSDDVAALIEAFPDIDVRLWPNFKQLAD